MKSILSILLFFIIHTSVSQKNIDTTKVVSIRTGHIVNLKNNVISFPHETVTEYKSGYIKTQIGVMTSITKYYPEDLSLIFNKEKYSPVFDKKNGTIKTAKSDRYKFTFKFNKEKQIILSEKISIQKHINRPKIMKQYYFYDDGKLIRKDKYAFRDSNSKDSLIGQSVVYKYKNGL